jgi:hypothetical protein
MISMNSLTIAAVSRVFAVYVPAYVIFRNDDAAGGLAACGCVSAFFFIIIAIIALNIAILVWVAKDAKNRGMDSAVIWMILVLLTGIIGLILYILTRPKGDLVICPHCNNKRMQVSAKCPHCGNA